MSTMSNVANLYWRRFWRAFRRMRVTRATRTPMGKVGSSYLR